MATIHQKVAIGERERDDSCKGCATNSFIMSIFGRGLTWLCSKASDDELGLPLTLFTQVDEDKGVGIVFVGNSYDVSGVGEMGSTLRSLIMSR